MQTTALPSQLQLGLPSTLFYPRMTFWTIGNAAPKARRVVTKGLPLVTFQILPLRVDAHGVQ